MKGVKYMKCNITGRNLEITESIKTAVEEKITKLSRYFAPDVVAQVTMSMEKNRQKVEITIPVKGNVIRAESENSDMYVSIDLVEEIIERQLKKYKNKIIDAKHASENFRQEFLDKDYSDDDEIKIVRTKRVDIKPMYPEDACVQMELLGHNCKSLTSDNLYLFIIRIVLAEEIILNKVSILLLINNLLLVTCNLTLNNLNHKVN